MITDKLMEAAQNASLNSYSPYSSYKVGASLITEQNNIFIGTNVENSSYGGTICAERNAITTAVTNEGPNMKIKMLVIYTKSSPPAPPCGLCLQVIAEFASDTLPIILINDTEKTEHILSDFLPLAFRSHHL